MALLDLRDLRVQIGNAKILRGVTMSLEAGQTLGVVGESGCGKSITGLSIMGMLPPGAKTGGQILFEGNDLTQLKPRDWLAIRGQKISMVMQDPFTSLNPLMRVGDQIAEVFRLHQSLSKAESWNRAVEMIGKVGVPSPDSSARKFPHQMSGGQRQRIVIAIAFASKPKLLIADEPTTALDVTLQAQVLELLRTMQEEEGTAVILISHDISVVGAMADYVAVFYAGGVVEIGTAAQVLHSPAHPYTKALLRALPHAGLGRLEVIGGQPPRLSDPVSGCPFAPRCVERFEKCSEEPPFTEIVDGHKAACWRAASVAQVPRGC